MTKPAEWIPLLNYSSRFGVSLSTLRRRIKAKTIQFKIDNGKYLLLADGHESAEVHHPGSEMAIQPQPGSTHRTAVNPQPSAFKKDSSAEHQDQTKPSNNNRQAVSFHHELPTHTFVEASVLSSANRLVEEIKAAYAKILQEKEEQISLLKEEAVDLRMLVKILEDNTRRNLEEVIQLRQQIVRQNAENLEQTNRASGREEPYNSNYDTAFGASRHENETGAHVAPPSESESNFDSYLFENFQSRDV